MLANRPEHKEHETKHVDAVLWVRNPLSAVGAPPEAWLMRSLSEFVALADSVSALLLLWLFVQ
eukprot:2330279-Lingulodinium_polyedra.AAC.1